MKIRFSKTWNSNFESNFVCVIEKRWTAQPEIIRSHSLLIQSQPNAICLSDHCIVAHMKFIATDLESEIENREKINWKNEIRHSDDEAKAEKEN